MAMAKNIDANFHVWFFSLFLSLSVIISLSFEYIIRYLLGGCSRSKWEGGVVGELRKFDIM